MVNVIRLSSANSPQHEAAKCALCMALMKHDHDFITEAIFNNGTRGDIINLNSGIIYEITYSETKDSLEQKRLSYPDIFEIVRVDANKGFNEEDIQ